MGVERLRQVFLVAADMDAQVAFLSDVLGLKLEFRDGAEWAQFAAGDVSVALAGPGESLGAPAGTSVPVFQTDALEDLCAAIERAGGCCGRIRDMGDHGRTVLFRDTTGAVMAALQKAAANE